jgi:hypothetical protein
MSYTLDLKSSPMGEKGEASKIILSNRMTTFREYLGCYFCLYFLRHSCKKSMTKCPWTVARIRRRQKSAVNRERVRKGRLEQKLSYSQEAIKGIGGAGNEGTVVQGPVGEVLPISPSLWFNSPLPLPPSLRE